MGKPYRFRNLISLFVIVIMLSSSFLTVLCFAILRALEILPNTFFATVWMPVIIVLVANVITACVHFIFVPKVIRPIEALISATDQVAKGDFSVRIEEKELVGEMRDLVQSFNAMTEELGGIEIFRNDFIQNFSHEFKTPIVSLKGFAGQLKNPALSEEERHQYCDIIISESERLSKMTEGVLLLSKLEHQQIVSDKAPYRLDEQLRDCLLLLQKKWEDKNLELDLDLPPVTVVQNADLLQHVWTNLLSNAVKFTPEGGTIALTVSETEASVTVTVKDTGIGMTEEELLHVFDKCYQADPSHHGEGNGLGLCIARRACVLSEGRITVSSKCGEGTVFTVIFNK